MSNGPISPRSSSSDDVGLAAAGRCRAGFRCSRTASQAGSGEAAADVQDGPRRGVGLGVPTSLGGALPAPAPMRTLEISRQDRRVRVDGHERGRGESSEVACTALARCATGCRRRDATRSVADWPTTCRRGCVGEILQSHGDGPFGKGGAARWSGPQVSGGAGRSRGGLVVGQAAWPAAAGASCSRRGHRRQSGTCRC
jgi:hypothetical protein